VKHLLSRVNIYGNFFGAFSEVQRPLERHHVYFAKHFPQSEKNNLLPVIWDFLHQFVMILNHFVVFWAIDLGA
jgi:hypothetical protein